MPNKTSLSSWGSLKNYLSNYIDKDKNWDNEEMSDYSALSGAYASGKITGDQLAEGKILLKNYLADVDAVNTRDAAMAQAENTARQTNAYQNFLNTRLASYLGEMQGNNGMRGYGGLAQGQQLSLKNSQENAFMQAQELKRTTLSDILKSYQNSVSGNSANAIDEQTTLQASRDQKRDTQLQDYLSKIDTYINGDGVNDGNLQNGVLTADKKGKLDEYIAGIPDENVRNEVEKYLDFQYGDKMQGTETITKEDGTTETKVVEAQSKVNSQNQKANDYSVSLKTTTSPSVLATTKSEIENAHNSGELSDEGYNKLVSEVREREKEVYKSSKSSGGISAGNTCTIKLSDGSKTTITTQPLGQKNAKISPDNDIVKNMQSGQVCIYQGTVYVCNGKGTLYRVCDYAGSGAYEKIYDHLKGTYYDIQ